MKIQSQSLAKNRRFRDLTEGEATHLMNTVRRKVQKLLPPGSDFLLVVTDGPSRGKGWMSRRDPDLIAETVSMVDAMKPPHRRVESMG